MFKLTLHNVPLLNAPLGPPRYFSSDLDRAQEFRELEFKYRDEGLYASTPARRVSVVAVFPRSPGFRQVNRITIIIIIAVRACYTRQRRVFYSAR